MGSLVGIVVVVSRLVDASTPDLFGKWRSHATEYKLANARQRDERYYCNG